MTLQDLVIYSGGHTHWVIDKTHFSPLMILIVFAGWVTLALREEFAFRGYPSFRLQSAWGMWVALAVVCVVFTLEHTAAGWTWSRSVLGPPVGALLFGLAAFRTRGLAVPLGIHSAFNFCQWFMGQKQEVAGPFRAIVDVGFERQAEALGYTAYVVGMFLATLAFWLSAKRFNR